MTMVRAIDHCVLASRDLDAARDAYERLGFTVAPLGVHPFGTANQIIQFADRSYLELLSVVDASKIPETDDGLSFAAFNRDFLARAEGISALALTTADAGADADAFRSAGLAASRPFSFERGATGPDGSEHPVSFSLAFAPDARLARALVFTCHHHRPENFWHEAYQTHANGAQGLSGIVLVADNPSDFHEYASLVSGQRMMRATSFGVDLALDGATLSIMTPEAYRIFFDGEPAGADVPQFRAIRVATRSLAAVGGHLSEAGIACREQAGRLIVPAEFCGGLVLAFEEPSAKSA